MKVLELFKGTGSVGKYCQKYPEIYDEVVSLDIEEKFKATYTTDILEWNYKQYPTGYFDIIWGSPPCVEYSVLLYSCKGRVRNLELADSIVKKTLEIIDYLKPKFYLIENPHSGLLKSRPFMCDIPYYVVSYCMYNFDYRKNTCIWSNLQGFTPLKCNKEFGKMIGNRHIRNLGNTKYAVVSSRLQRYSIPQDLIHSLFTTALQQV